MSVVVRVEHCLIGWGTEWEVLVGICGDLRLRHVCRHRETAQVSSALPEAVTRMYGSRVAEIRCEYERICECAEVARTNPNSSNGEHQKMKPSRNERSTRPLDGQGANFDTKTLDAAYPPVCAQLLARRLWSDLHRRKKLPASTYTYIPRQRSFASSQLRYGRSLYGRRHGRRGNL